MSTVFASFRTRAQNMKHVILSWFDLRYSHKQKIISFQIIMWVFSSKLAIWSWIWCFTAEVKQTSTVTKELYVLRLWESFHGCGSWMNWPDTDSVLSLDDYFFSVCEHWIFISLHLQSNSGWSWLAGLRKKEEVTERHKSIHTQSMISPTSFT